MLTSFMDKIVEFLMNFSMFGIRPFRGIYTIFNSTGFWTFLICMVILFSICNYFRRTGLFALINIVFKSLFKVIKSTFKFIGWVITQTYMMILMSIDSVKNNYEKSEYWETRIFTLEGIKAKDLTGSEEILIPHFKIVSSIIHFYKKILRIISNIEISISRKFAK